MVGLWQWVSHINYCVFFVNNIYIYYLHIHQPMPSLIHSQGTLRQCRKFANAPMLRQQMIGRWRSAVKGMGSLTSDIMYVHIYIYIFKDAFEYIYIFNYIRCLWIYIYIYLIIYRHIHIILFYILCKKRQYVNIYIHNYMSLHCVHCSQKWLQFLLV